MIGWAAYAALWIIAFVWLMLPPEDPLAPA